MEIMMALPVLFSFIIIVITIFIHGIGSAFWLRYLTRRHHFKGSTYSIGRCLKMLSFTGVFFLLLHYIEIITWAILFYAIPEYDKLNSWEEAIYFSMVTYTTTGYGDITLPPVWRILGGFEAMSGILLFGWSTAMFYAVVQKLMSNMSSKN